MTESAVEILLVEDNPNDRELAARAFKKHNLANHVLAMEDGEQALEFMFRQGRYAGHPRVDQPKLILLDLKLPKMDGLEVLRKLKADERTKSIPIVMMTSSRQESDVVESYRLGVNSYIVKPIDFDKFLEAVSSLSFYWLLLNHPPK